eukprot:NODE_2305_length_1236_cov_35.208088_g2101_i0.p1 GENE.NODE_2305_length_1236_cov_35.208088_g2101_i0~~NODE_2305_length_1236_cov_35.208088_g2101_i0.p1  ORF type:complete len:206 (+),score=35.86 NODE_2305_length_1236_cov_35.208088_g2101_i0:530-1147(+)
MRIAPVGLLAAVRGQSDSVLKQNIYLAPRCTHDNDEAMVSCFLYCRLLAALTSLPTPELGQASSPALVQTIRTAVVPVENHHLAAKLKVFDECIEELVKKPAARSDDKCFLQKVISQCPFGELFAIRSSEALVVALYALSLSALIGPEEALIRVVNWGGDADTVGCIAGGLLGALYGDEWLPPRWTEPLESRNEIILMAKKLSGN